MGKLFFIGASITMGLWDRQGGWVNRLIGQIMDETLKGSLRSFECKPYNLAVSGNTVPDLLNRITPEVSSRLKCNTKENVQIVFSIGSTDSSYLFNEGVGKFSDEDFYSNIERLIIVAKQLAQKVSFVGLTPVDESLVTPTSWNPEMAYKNESIERFEGIVVQLCEKHSIPFLPIFDEWASRPDYKELLFDGVHPNTKGHALLADKISSFLFDDDFYEFYTE